MKESEKKSGVMTLWQLCFQDTQEFVQMYFDRKYKEENTFVFRDSEGEVAAALQLLPYTMTFAGDEVDISYISGACTRIDFRDQGVMTRLLWEALQEMWERGTAFATLIPQEKGVFEYYRRLGFVAVFDYTLNTYRVEERREPTTRVERFSRIPDDPSAYFRYFSRCLQKRSCCVQHDEEDFSILMEDISLCGGFLFVARDRQDAIVGMAFAQLDGERIRVNDCFFDAEEVKRDLLQEMSQVWGRKTIVVRSLPEEKSSSPRGMARVVHVKEMLKRYAAYYVGEAFNLIVTDPILRQNTGHYVVKRGQLLQGVLLEKYPLFRLDVGELTRLLLSGHEQRPFISLMLD